MALNDAATLVAAVGYVFTGDPGSTPPTPAELTALDLTTFATLDAAWTQVGHTSREEMPEFGRDGGAYTMRGTWQKKRLRLVQTGEPAIDYVKLNLKQFDDAALELYIGANSSGTDNIYGTDGEFVPVEKSLLIVLTDGVGRLGFYASKSSWTRDASIKLPVDDFTSLPVKGQFLNNGTDRLYDWISEDFIAPAV